MTDTDNIEAKEPGAALLDALTANDSSEATRILESVSPADGIRLLLQLDPEERSHLLDMIDPELAAGLIEDLPEEQAAELVEDLEIDRAAAIIDEMESPDQVDLISELDPADAEAILAKMDPESAEDVRRLSEYDPHSAGGLMSADVFQFRSDETVGAILSRIAVAGEDFERFRGQHPYVVDQANRLVGVISLRTLLTSRPSTPLSDVMTQPRSANAAMTLDELEDIFEAHPFLGMPVVDEAGLLIGAVSRTAVAEATRERADQDSLKIQGVVGDEIRSMPVTLRARRRLAWLSVNIGLNVIAASVITFYEDTLTAVIALAVFLPIVSDMSGCSGNQAVAVSLRELSLGVAKPVDVVRVWLKEISIGSINGAALGLLIGLVAYLWKGNIWIGAVVGAALAINTLIAVSIGGTVPLLLKRFDIDPAIASGPMLTTITDMAGFFLVLSLASVMMPIILAG